MNENFNVSMCIRVQRVTLGVRITGVSVTLKACVKLILCVNCNCTTLLFTQNRVTCGYWWRDLMLTLPCGCTVLVCDTDPIFNEEMQSDFTVRLIVIYGTVTCNTGLCLQLCDSHFTTGTCTADVLLKLCLQALIYTNYGWKLSLFYTWPAPQTLSFKN